MKVKFPLKVSRSFLLSLFASVLVLSLTLLIMPFYIGGDLTRYRDVYEALPSYGLIDGFSFYTRWLTSREVVHFFLSWTASHFLSKDLFIAFSNAIFAYVIMSLFQKLRASIIISFLLLLTNYYFIILYFPAERLKFGFIFLAFSMIYSGRIKHIFGFATLAIISHAQMIIVYISMLFNLFIKKVLSTLKTGKVSILLLFLIPCLIIVSLLVGTQIYDKFLSYYGQRGLMDMGKIIIFLILALWYSKKKSETFLIFIPLTIAVFFVGGSRVNLYGYFVFLYYGLQCRGGWNLGVLTTSAYYAYSSIGFVMKIFQYGNGFYK